jgi:cephalosporin hydroxylase
MTEPAPGAPTPPRSQRIPIILAVGFACLSLLLLARGILEKRSCEEEKRELASTQSTIDRFHKLYYNSPFTNGANRWLGVLTVQNPNDVWIIQEILFEVKPDFLVEAGTYKGGSAVLWAMVLREIKPSSRVITIDIEDQVADATKKLPIFQERIDFLVGSSTAPEITAEVKRRVAGHPVVFLLDSNHRKEHVLAELRAYADMIQVGGYIIVQDSNINGHPVFLDPNGPGGYYAGHPGPMEAIDEFLASDGRFLSDPRRERLMMTISPRGYLRRMR